MEEGAPAPSRVRYARAMIARAAPSLLAVSLVACGGAPPVTLTCRPSPETRAPGVALAAAFVIENTSTETVTILGMTVPWLYRHAVRFSAPGFEDPRVLADPGEYETLILLPGETAGGEVLLADRLLDGYGRSLEEVPGTYGVSADARLGLDPESSRARTLPVRCDFEVAIPVRE